jgi:glycosyltransferase involved in cell wall biosynthesis
MNDFISVIIPAYNAANYLADAIDSVLAQTYRNFEIIVVDDGSTDKTYDVIKKNYSKKIKYIYQENKGPSAARNAGIEAAKGEFLAFLDADDIWSSRKLEEQYKTYEQYPKLGVVFTGYTHIDLNKRIKRDYSPPRYNNQKEFLKKLLVRNIVTASDSSVMIRKRCLEDVGLFDPALRGAEDWDLWVRIAVKYQFGALESPFVTIREHAQNATRDAKKLMSYSTRVIVQNLTRCERIFTKRELNLLKRKAFSFLYLNAAQSLRDDPNKRKEMRKYLVTSIITYPFKTFERDDKYVLFVKSILRNQISAKLGKVKMLTLSFLYPKGHSKVKPDHEDV